VAGEVLAEDARMTNLVEDLLLLARSDEGHLLPAGEATDLWAAAESAVEQRASMAVPVVVHGTPTPVAIPLAYIEHIVRNLVDNATRYAIDQVEVRVWSEGNKALLQVADDGPGVADADRARIFERFVRLDEARDRVHGGFGLGLAIVADLCRAYGGSIEVTDGHPGAVFTVEFALATSVPRRRRVTQPTEPLAPAPA
jgi:signal transduction histidine kinase